MQIAVTIALTATYLGLSLTLGGVHSNNGPWWFFLPCIVSICAFVVAKMIMAKLPLPWVNEQGYSSPPRRVHLSWRATVRLPAYAPFLLILWHFLSILRMHFDIDWVLCCVIMLVLGMMTIVALRRWREIRLLRSGEVGMAFINSRENTAEWQDDRIYYHFKTARGADVSGRAFYVGYDVLEGSIIPVFYDPKNPSDHVVACASWFEAD
ncbi:MAG: hypothetical protein OS130_04585 [Thermodesulfobacteriota bacterium]|jgi:hypothetical protein|nr:MAG: hypothetical protein OS130_04585 [Thermodesulfobacteriota bacterium]